MRWMGATDGGASIGEIEAVYRARLPELRRVAAAIVGDRDLARDAVQDAFATAVRRRGDFRRTGPLEAWLWRIVVNAARSKQRSAPGDEPLGADAAVRTNGHRDAFVDSVRVAVSLLPERQRLVLFLRYYADLDYATIADALDIAPGTVGATLNAAHAGMRRLLEEVKP